MACAISLVLILRALLSKLEVSESKFGCDIVVAAAVDVVTGMP